MTILPKKKGKEESDSDSDHSSRSSPTQRTHGSTSHPHGHAHSSHSSPRPSEDSSYHHHLSPTESYYHRRYDVSGSSSGDSSPELPAHGKRPSYRPPSSAGTGSSGVRGKKTLDASPYYSGYNSSEEYEGPHRPYTDPEMERRFEQALKKECKFEIKKMRPDGACLFRAVADQVYGDQEMHTVVRNQCMDYMLKNAEYFSQYMTEDFEHYINRKRSYHCYGNNLEMQAIAEMYNRKIEVYQYSTEPINIFFGVYKTDNAPIRLSYHCNIHYNSVVDPYKATIGVGLGLAGHKPGAADKALVHEAVRDSENVHLEKTMLEDKLRSTDWDATCEAIEEAVARESYLTWLREQERRVLASRQGTQSTSAACGSSVPSSVHPPLPPPMSATSTMLSSPLPISHTHTSTLSSSFLPSSTSAPKLPPTTNTMLNFRGSPLYTTAETKPVVSSSTSSRNGSLPGSRRGSHRGTPSPTGSLTYRGLPAGTHHGSVRNSPYVSPHTSPRGSLRGSPRGSPRSSTSSSPHGSAHSSPRNSVHGSPPPAVPQQLHLGTRGSVDVLPPGRGGSHSPDLSPQHGSPPPTVSWQGVSTSPTTSPSSPHQHPHLGAGPALSPSPPHSSPPPQQHSVDFESGRVLTQLPYEYSSFLDLPPSAFGLSEWEDDRVLAAVLAASQQEYIDSLRHNARGAEGL